MAHEFSMPLENPVRLTVYSRAYCHLCDDMIAGLRDMQAGGRFMLDVIDVDSDPALEARFGELVPVLMSADGELCHYHLDAAKLNDYLSKIG
jgi:thioredoxin reductase (NADPH)